MIIIAQRGILEAMSTANTHTLNPPHVHTLSLHILHGGVDFQAIRLLVSH